MSETGERRALRSLVPWRSGTFYIIIASSMMGVMGITLVSPVLPALRPVFDISDPQVGLVMTVYTLPGIFLTPVIGLVADRLGRKRVLIPLLFTFGIAGSAIAFAPSFTVVLALRFLQGIGATALVMLSITMIGDIWKGPTRRTLIGINGSSISTASAFYPLIGGGLAVIYWGLPFLLFAIGIIVGLIAIVILEDHPIENPMSTGQYLGRMLKAVTMPRALAIFAATLVLFVLHFGAIITALPLLLSDEYGLTSGEIGVVLAMVAVSSATIASQFGRITRWQSPAQIMALGFVTLGVGLLLVRLAPTAWFVGLALLVFGLGLGVLMPAFDTVIVAIASEDLRAGMMGMRTSLIRAGQTIGPALFTVAADSLFATTVSGYQTLMWMSGSFALGTGLLAYVLVSSDVLSSR